MSKIIEMAFTEIRNCQNKVWVFEKWHTFYDGWQKIARLLMKPFYHWPFINVLCDYPYVDIMKFVAFLTAEL